MDALRNTLLELSLSASPCSNVAGPNADVWGLPRPSDEDGVLSGHAPSWKSRRGPDSAHLPQHQRQRHRHHRSSARPNQLSSHPNTSFGRSGAFSSSYLSTHDGAGDNFDERQHLREALRSAVGASDFSSRMSSPNTRPSRFYPSVRHGRLEDEEEEEDRNLGSDDDGDECCTGGCADGCHTQFFTMLPVSETGTEDLLSLTPLEQGHRGVSSEADSSPHHLPTPPTTTDVPPAAAAAAGGASGAVDSGADMRPLQLSMSLLQARRGTPPAPTAIVTGSRRPPLAAHATQPVAPTPLSTTKVSSPLLRVQSSMSSGYCADDAVISPYVPERGQPLLRPSSRHVSAAAEEKMEGEVHGEEHVSVTDVPLHTLHPEMWMPSRDSSLDDTDAPTGAAPAIERQPENKTLSTTQGLSISFAIAAVAEHLSRSSPTINAAAQAATATTMSRNVSTPSHLSTPVMVLRHGNVSPLHCHTPLALDDHAIVHVFATPDIVPPDAETAAVAAEKDVAAVVVPAADLHLPSPTSESARLPLLIPQPHRGGRDIHGRTVLLRAHRHFGSLQTQRKLSQSHSAAPLHNPANAVAGSVGGSLRCGAAAGAAGAQSLGMFSDGTERVSSLPVGAEGLHSLPQPFGAYPYQWMVGGRGTGLQSSEGSYSTARRRRASSLTMSHPSSSYGTLSAATPGAVASLQRSVSDGQL